jgi:cytochrome c oxidase accessory protein FixG
VSDLPQKPLVERGRRVVRRPDLDTVFSINPDGSRNVIHPADVHGRFQRRKNVLWTLFIAIYLAMPWVTIGGRPAILIDIQRRAFFLFGHTFNAQDFWLAFFYISGLGFTLFLVAAVFGRLWCGFACPHTVFLEAVFRRIERWIEGPAAARAKLDKAPPSAGKLLRRAAKYAVFLAISAVITHSFLGYFMPVAEVVQAMTSPPAQHLTAFLFAAVSTVIVFVNFTWFREQLCIVVCPYGRLQGALYDQDTLLVGYDQRRGEPRAPAGTAGGGDCVDCYRCVAVCPTGIDIRNGTQMECVGCANCIDACDEVMHRLGRRPGLVRYDSLRGFATGLRRFWRPRLLLYSVLLAVGAGVFLFAASRRHVFEANLVRGAGNPFTLEAGQVKNVFYLHLINKLPTSATYHIEPRAAAGFDVAIATRDVPMQSLQDSKIPVIVLIAEANWRPPMQVQLSVSTADGPAPMEVLVQAPLLGPSGR